MTTDKLSYTIADMRVPATIMLHAHDARIIYANQQVITHRLKQGIAKFGGYAEPTAMKEMKSMSATDRKHVLESLTFLTEKIDRLIKGRHCANGNPQLQWMDREQVSSPTVMPESTMITSIIEAKENGDVAKSDITNAFIQIEVERKDKD